MRNDAMRPDTGGPTGEDSYFRPQDRPLEAAPAQNTPGAGITDFPVATPATPVSEQPPAPPTATAARNVPFRPLDRNQSAIRLRRLRGQTLPGGTQPPAQAQAQTQTQAQAQAQNAASSQTVAAADRRRSGSEPQRPVLVQGDGEGGLYIKPLATVPEGSTHVDPAIGALKLSQQQANPSSGGWHRLLGRRRQTAAPQPRGSVAPEDCYDSRIVDLLDVIGKSPCLADLRCPFDGKEINGPLARPRGRHLVLHHECPKLSLRPLARQVGQPEADLRLVTAAADARRLPAFG